MFLSFLLIEIENTIKKNVIQFARRSTFQLCEFC